MCLAQNKLLPLGSMARRLKVSSRWLRIEAESGRLPHLKADNQILFEPNTVIDILVERAKKYTE